MGLAIEGEFGPAFSHAEAQRALNVRLNDRPSRRTANSTVHLHQCARLSNLMFNTPCRHAAASDFDFLSSP
jgi:hypothetical protein